MFKTEAESNQQRYSESQARGGLRAAWQDLTGVDDPFDADTRIDTFMKADGSWDELDFAEIFRGIERFFGFVCTDSEWKEFFGFNVAERSLDEWERIVAPTLTFGSLAHFVAARAPVVATFNPIRVVGRECAPAGAFTGIQSVANKATGRRLRFPPNARIFEVVQGHELDNFWTQLRWMTENAAPELPAFWRNVTGVTGGLGVIAVIAALIATWATSNPVWIVSTLILSVVAYLIAWTYKVAFLHETYLVCPMHPERTGSKNPHCEICGMSKLPAWRVPPAKAGSPHPD